MRTKIYTKGGDLGETSLLGGQRVSKSNPQLEAYGTVDELNAAIGICICHIDTNSEPLQNLLHTLQTTQSELFNIGSHLACIDDSLKDKLPRLSDTFILHLENQIDEMTSHLPELREFILPGGHPLSAALHLARTICRRAERHIVSCEISPPKPESLTYRQIVTFINRLSDYLFVAARFANYIHKVNEVKWQKK